MVWADCIGAVAGRVDGGQSILTPSGRQEHLLFLRLPWSPAAGREQYVHLCQEQGLCRVAHTLPEIVGLAPKDGHAGYYVGDGGPVEWKTAYGCVKSAVKGRAGRTGTRLSLIMGSADRNAWDAELPLAQANRATVAGQDVKTTA